MKSRQQQLLNEKVTWYDCIRDMERFDGVVLANEVLDNFAVHQVVMQEDLMEVYVDYNGHFSEILVPAPQVLKAYFGHLGIVLPRGYRTEINLEMKDWIRDIADMTRTAVVFTMDYGSGSAELYSPQRRSGTLLCYFQHARNDQYYLNPGRQDITAHVNFSALKYFGELSGLCFGGFTTQADFLLSLGLSAHLGNATAGAVGSTAQLRMLQNLLLDIGKKIKVMALQKGFTHPLRGMQFPAPLV